MVAPQAGDGGADRLARMAVMVTDAVDLLNQVMEEIKSERGYGENDDGSGEPDGNIEQTERRR